MADIKRKASFIKLGLELVEQSIVLIAVELKLAVLEIKRNLNAAKNGAIFLAMGGFLLLFSLLTLTATAIAALSLVLPVWLSALIVSAVLVFGGAGLLFTGLSKVKHFTLVPRETVDRVENIANTLKKNAEERERREHEELVAREAAHAAAARAVLEEKEARRAARAEAARIAQETREARVARRRELRLAKAREKVKEAEQSREARRRRAA